MPHMTGGRALWQAHQHGCSRVSQQPLCRWHRLDLHCMRAALLGSPWCCSFATPALRCSPQQPCSTRAALRCSSNHKQQNGVGCLCAQLMEAFGCAVGVCVLCCGMRMAKLTLQRWLMSLDAGVGLVTTACSTPVDNRHASLRILPAGAGDVPEAAVLESLGAATGPAERDVLEGLPNEEALQARQVVAALKLSKQELEEHILPEDWDATTTDWFTNKDEEDTPLPEYKLVFLWMDKNIAVGVDQVYARGNSSPLTEYFVWPRKDAWDELKVALEGRQWIGDLDKVRLLNRLTEVINFWMGEPGPDGTPSVKRSIEEARAEFPDCAFAGTL
ncbi:plastid and cyanobacterial ribosomal protein-domain-containing protein [Scenedesmus sp. NREL 46B-D3]|nr:plastid and cyanobacterial ribosomal protein-domain-containing protein [Scenedesmus sp. NREL 46B-D3]